MTQQRDGEVVPYLAANPFWILGVSPDAGVEEVTDAYEDALDDHAVDERVLAAAYQALSSPSRRLGAEISWPLGLAVDAVRALLTDLSSAASDWTSIARINMAFEYFLSQPDEVRATEVLAAWRAYDETQLLGVLEGVRGRAGLPKPAEDAVAQERMALRERHLDAICDFAIKRQDGGDMLVGWIRGLDDTPPDEVTVALFERYDAALSPRLSLRKERMLEAIPSLALADDEQAEAVISGLDGELAGWVADVGPLYWLDMARGLDERHTGELLLAFEEAFSDATEADPPIGIGRLREVIARLKDRFSDFTDIYDRISALAIVAETLGAVRAARVAEPGYYECEDRLGDDVEGFLDAVRQGSFSEGGEGLAGELYGEFAKALSRQDDLLVRSGLWCSAVKLIGISEITMGAGRAAEMLEASFSPLLDRFPPEQDVRVMLDGAFLQVRRQAVVGRVQSALEREDKEGALQAINQLIAMTTDYKSREELRLVREQIRSTAGPVARAFFYVVLVVVLVLNLIWLFS